MRWRRDSATRHSGAERRAQFPDILLLFESVDSRFDRGGCGAQCGTEACAHAGGSGGRESVQAVAERVAVAQHDDDFGTLHGRVRRGQAGVGFEGRDAGEPEDFRIGKPVVIRFFDGA
jgi:hypothetical protein